MTDRELLEFAAKAAGYIQTKTNDANWFYVCVYPGFNDSGDDREWELWNPLDDDGDALRLAVKLRISPTLRALGCDASDTQKAMAYERYRDDPYAATRRAITRAAAEIGRNMK